MTQDANQYWWLITLRAAIALTASLFLIFLPGMMKSIFLMPIALVSMILALAIYGIADSLTLLLTGLKVAPRSRWRRALLIQAALGIAIGGVLLTVALNKVELRWFIALAAVQAFSAGYGEIAMAKKSCHSNRDRWTCYTTGTVAIAAGLALLLVIKADLVDLMWWLTGYVTLFGLSLLFLSIRLWVTRHHDLIQQHSAWPVVRSA